MLLYQTKVVVLVLVLCLHYYYLLFLAVAVASVSVDNYSIVLHIIVLLHRPVSAP